MRLRHHNFLKIESPFRLLGWGLVLIVTWGIAGCTPTPTEPLHHQQFLALGTLVDVSIWGGDKVHADQAMTAVAQHLNEIHQRWHAWQPGPLTQLNTALATGEAVEVDPAMLAVIQRAQHLSQTSGGLFNPAIGKLIGLWGFHSDERADGPPPADAAIKQLVAQHPTLDDLRIEDGKLRSTNPALQLDMASYIKGYAVNQAVDILKDRGITNAIINAGGDLRAIGRHGDRPWRIGIRDPRGPGMLASLEVQGDECVFTSGDYERYFTYQGQRYHHIIDPRTGYPATGATSATVVFSGAMTAEAATSAATALIVAGPERWLEVAKNMGLTQVMLVGRDQQIYMTSAMARRAHFDQKPAPKVIIRDPA